MVLASSCRRKIIIVLHKYGQVNVMMLVRKVNGTYSRVNPSLLILAREGITVEQRLGHKRIIKLNMENHKTQVLLQVLKIFERSKLKKQS